MVMQRKENIMIKVVALATAATGLFSFIRFGRSNLQFVTGFHRVLEMTNPLLAVLGLVVMIIPIVKTVAAVGIFRNQSWAWFVATAALFFDSVFRVAGAINWALIVAFVPPTPQPRIPQGAVTCSGSILPSFVIAIISLISIFILIQKPIKDQFTKADKLA